jgi:hypothetical protein
MKWNWTVGPISSGVLRVQPTTDMLARSGNATQPWVFESSATYQMTTPCSPNGTLLVWVLRPGSGSSPPDWA